MTMRVLVTGGAGFLGVNLAHHLSMHGATVISLDIATSLASEYPPGTIFRVGDVRDPGTVSRTLAENGPIDVVIHAAAALPLWRPHDIRTTNIAGTHTVLDCARSAGVPRTVFISSTAVYGVPDKHPIDETDPMIGVGPYGESKVAAEQLCAAYRAQGYCVPVVRPKTFLGPGRLGVFQILYDWVFSGKRIPILGSGHNRYQLLEVSDLCDAIWRAATHASDRVNDIFNVGASRFATVAEDVGALCRHAGTRAQVFPVPAWPAKTALRTLESVNLSPLYRWVYGTADRDSYVSTKKIGDALDWHPRHSNVEALIHAYDWYVEHRAELGASTGVTHRVAWDQGALALLKKLL